MKSLTTIALFTLTLLSFSGIASADEARDLRTQEKRLEMMKDTMDDLIRLGGGESKTDSDRSRSRGNRGKVDRESKKGESPRRRGGRYCSPRQGNCLEDDFRVIDLLTKAQDKLLGATEYLWEAQDEIDSGMFKKGLATHARMCGQLAFSAGYVARARSEAIFNADFDTAYSTDDDFIAIIEEANEFITDPNLPCNFRPIRI